VTRRETLARHPLAIVGALIATASAVAFVVLVIAALAGLFANPYAGLVVFIVIPALFVVGLALIPVGMWLQARALAHDPSAADWPVLDFGRARVRRMTLAITALTAVNIVIVLLAGYGSLHWMESPMFCGQVCHTPMQPQFMAWQGASHANVTCVQCHVGEGARGFVHAKLAGVRQLVHVVTNAVPAPIPPAENLPPVSQTCDNCHRPGHPATADRVRVLRSYGDDEKNTETATLLQMHLGAGSSSPKSIHWHADPAVRVEYVATDATRETIPYVKVRYANGQAKEFRAADAKDQAPSGGTRHTMDCRDCHNRVGHPFAPSPEQGIDDAIAANAVNRDLPFIRREAVRLVKVTYPSESDAMRAIESGLHDFYQSHGGSVDQTATAASVAAVQGVYRRNVFPKMKVSFGSYPDLKGHTTATGCFRCHDDSHAAADGSVISAECELCHTQLEAPSPISRSPSGTP
jgi:hypothetical protein